MTESGNGRRKAVKGEGTVYWDKAKNTYRAEISVGFTRSGRRKRLTAYGTTETKARNALKKKLKDHEAGLDTSNTYTVADAVNDWHKRSRKPGRGEETWKRDRYVIDGQIIPTIGRIKLKELTADDVDDMLLNFATTHATSSLKKIRSVLKRAITFAQRRDKVGRNVAELVEVPEGKPGRPSKAMHPDDVKAVFKAAEGTWMEAYLKVSNFTGIRTEEVRPLEWSRTHLNPVEGEECSCGRWHRETLPPHVEVWRSVRSHGDTKTEKSRRTIALPSQVVRALSDHRARDLAWRKEHGYKHEGVRYVFGTRHDTVKLARNVRRYYRVILEDAGLDPEKWAPRETRHTFVSIMSDLGASDDVIADLVGHKDTRTTRQVYRHQLRPVITRGAEMIEEAFGSDG